MGEYRCSFGVGRGPPARTEKPVKACSPWLGLYREARSAIWPRCSGRCWASASALGWGKRPRIATERRHERPPEERGRDNDRNRTATGQGAAPNKGNVSVNITPEKRTQIHQVFTKERSAPRVDRVDFDLAVGTAVPRSVRFVSVPSTIIAIEPSWRGYDYFMVGDQIVIVDPRSMEIVAIIDA
jgi:Protein of unknown function (DUF1236)